MIHATGPDSPAMSQHTAAPVNGESTSAPSSTPMRRVALASCAGTTIEFYDFFIYGTAAALVFPTVFFPALGDSAASVASFATFAVAFGARQQGDHAAITPARSKSKERRSSDGKALSSQRRSSSPGHSYQRADTRQKDARVICARRCRPF